MALRSYLNSTSIDLGCTVGDHLGSGRQLARNSTINPSSSRHTLNPHVQSSSSTIIPNSFAIPFAATLMF